MDSLIRKALLVRIIANTETVGLVSTSPFFSQSRIGWPSVCHHRSAFPKAFSCQLSFVSSATKCVGGWACSRLSNRTPTTHVHISFRSHDAEIRSFRKCNHCIVKQVEFWVRMHKSDGSVKCDEKTPLMNHLVDDNGTVKQIHVPYKNC